MERNITNLKHELDPTLEIDLKSVHLMNFQGEMSCVYAAKSHIYGDIVIKTALTKEGLSQTGVDEIARNLSGYKQIPNQFRPEVLSINTDKTIMVMKHAGLPLRDLLWINRENPTVCETIVGEFQNNLTRLYKLSKNVCASLECKTYLEKLITKGNSFLSAGFFPKVLRSGFDKITRIALAKNESVGAFANMDATQGNLLIDISRKPQTLKLIDPKLPRITNGIENFTGVSEVDLGMFLVTVDLNSPDVLPRLDLEKVLISVGQTIHNNQENVKLYLDLGKVFGCILVASFPNTVARVRTYFKSFGVDLTDNKLRDVLIERERHIDKAIKIVNNY